MFKHEVELAEFIIKNSWIIDEDLTLIEKEINIPSEREVNINLLFKNKSDKYWAIELKNGLILPENVSTFIKHVGFLSQKYNLNRESFNLVLIGDNFSKEVKFFCSLFNIRLVELNLVDELNNRIKAYIENLKKKVALKESFEENISAPHISSDLSDECLEITNELLLSSIFTEKRMELINEILRSKPSSIKELALSLNRDTKNVFEDLRLLQEAKIIDMLINGKKRVPTLRKKTIIIKLGGTI